MAVGANLGTTVTALLAALGSNNAGRRLAAAHILFNLVTALVALAILPSLTRTVDWLAEVLGMACRRLHAQAGAVSHPVQRARPADHAAVDSLDGEMADTLAAGCDPAGDAQASEAALSGTATHARAVPERVSAVARRYCAQGPGAGSAESGCAEPPGNSCGLVFAAG